MFGFGSHSLPPERLSGHEWVVEDSVALAAAIDRFLADVEPWR